MEPVDSRAQAPHRVRAALAGLVLLASFSRALSQTRVVAWGTALDPRAQSLESRNLAKSLANPASAQWRAKGDQRRTYRFAAAGADLPFRVCVPSAWNGRDALPLVMFLHGAGNNESSYLDQNGKQMVKLAEEHGVILVSPQGAQSAYGTFIKLPAVFDEQGEADKMLAQVTEQAVRANELSEKDVINVLEIVLNEYPVDSARVFLTGHSMGSGGAWYLGAKYSFYWRALAPMSGPFVLKQGYPWETILKMPVFVSEGTGSATTASSRLLRDWMRQQKGRIAFEEVAADHPGMVPLVLPHVFAFFDSVSAAPVSLGPVRRDPPAAYRAMSAPFAGEGRRIFDLRGRRVWKP